MTVLEEIWLGFSKWANGASEELREAAQDLKAFCLRFQEEVKNSVHKPTFVVPKTPVAKRLRRIRSKKNENAVQESDAPVRTMRSARKTAARSILEINIEPSKNTEKKIEVEKDTGPVSDGRKRTREEETDVQEAPRKARRVGKKRAMDKSSDVSENNLKHLNVYPVVKVQKLSAAEVKVLTDVRDKTNSSLNVKKAGTKVPAEALPKTVFSPYARLPVKDKVAAFKKLRSERERVAQQAALEVKAVEGSAEPVRMTRTKARALAAVAAAQTKEQQVDGEKKQQQQQQQQQQQPQQATPRCLRRADSGKPHDELTPRLDSVSTESSGSGGAPPSSTGNHSETSSGVHSNSSGSDKQAPPVQNQQPNNPRGRSTSVDDLSGQPVATQNWRSFSLQRNVQPPTAATVANISPPLPLYGFHPDATTNATVITAPGGVPAVLLESSTESAVVIRHKASRPKTTDGEVATDPPVLKDEPFSWSTNMRMTSFTDNPYHNTTATSSATLPHYPTQPHVAVAAVYPHCGTMPLPSSAAASSSSNGGTPTQVGNGGSCHSFPRHHTTIPTHGNGVRPFAGPNPFVKRFPPFHHQGNGLGPVVAGRVVVAVPVVYGTVGNSSGNTLDVGHHTFPSQVVKYSTPQYCGPQDRDSANFSMASSGDSDQYLPHHA